MSIGFDCQACGRRIQVADQHAGLEVRCPLCGAIIVAPAAEPPSGPPAAQPVAPKMSPPTYGVPTVAAAGEVRTGLAIGAMICGILGLCFAPLGLIGLVLGIVAVVKANQRPAEYGGSSMAVVGICTGAFSIVVLPVLIAILLPSLARARELSRRNICAANLRGINTGFYIYSTDNSEVWPVAFHPAAEQDRIGKVDYTQAIGSYRGQAGDREAGETSKLSPPPEKLSNTRNLWILIRNGMTSPRAMVCPSSDDAPNADDDPEVYWDFGEGDIMRPVTPAEAARFWKQVSYGLQVPYGKKGRPSMNCDQRMVLLAEKGPYGAAIDAGHPAPPPISGASTSFSPQDWKPWNSPNHDGEGQCVVYGDSHTEFMTKPTAGVRNDNIYTQWTGDGAQESDRALGHPPTLGGRETPASETDSLIYP